MMPREDAARVALTRAGAPGVYALEASDLLEALRHSRSTGDVALILDHLGIECQVIDHGDMVTVNRQGSSVQMPYQVASYAL